MSEPSAADIGSIASTWLRYQTRAKASEGPLPDDDPDWWAVERVIECTTTQLELGWQFVLALCARVETDDERTIDIGAGPIESMFFTFGDQAMDLVERSAPDNRVLLKALSAVWCWDEPFRPRLDRLLVEHGEVPGHPYLG